MKLNCWEAKQCGREPGGENNDELGTCPVATEHKAHGINNGINGGRACWAIKQNLCGHNSFAYKFVACLQCDFYSQVIYEEAENYTTTKQIWPLLNYKF